MTQISIALSLIILRLKMLSLVPLPCRNPFWSSDNCSSNFIFILLCMTLSNILQAWVIRLTVLWLLHSTAPSLFGMGINTDLQKSFGNAPCLYILLHNLVKYLVPSAPRYLKNSAGIPSIPHALLRTIYSFSRWWFTYTKAYTCTCTFIYIYLARLWWQLKARLKAAEEKNQNYNKH